MWRLQNTFIEDKINSLVRDNILFLVSTGDPVPGPMPPDATVDLTTYQDVFMRQTSLSGEVFNLEDSRLEDTIDNSTSLEDNSDIFDPEMPIPAEHALDVPYVKYSYLFQIANGFDPSARVGKGGFSEVFKGETARSKKLLAIKKLKDSPDARSLMNFEGNQNSHVII